MRRVPLVLAAVLTAAIALAGCGGSGSGAATTPSSGSTSAATSAGKITVAAGAALTEVFTSMGRQFESASPGSKVTFTFDNSVSLTGQILGGAPADVYAAPKDTNLQRLQTASRIAAPSTFATNTLVIITKPGNPDKITSLADLSRVGMVSLCSSNIPCGTLAAQVLARAGVTIPESQVTRGTTVKAALTAVTQGDAAAGIVFVTDARTAAAKVTTVTIPAAANATATLVIAPVVSGRGAQPTAGATAFITWVLGPAGQQALAQAGFGPKP